MKYSRAIKESVLRKVLPPENRSITEISKEYSIADQTICNWLEKAKNGTLDLELDEKSPRYMSSGEKYQLILEAASVSEEDKGSWIREKGFHSQHLELWEQTGVTNRNTDPSVFDILTPFTYIINGHTF